MAQQRTGVQPTESGSKPGPETASTVNSLVEAIDPSEHKVVDEAGPEMAAKKMLPWDSSPDILENVSPTGSSSASATQYLRLTASRLSKPLDECSSMVYDGRGHRQFKFSW